MIRELNLTRHEEKTFRWIVFREPIGRINKFAYRPLKGWTGVLIVVIVFIVYGAYLYLLFSLSRVPKSGTLPESVTPFERVLDKGLLFMAVIAFSLALWTRNRIIRKLYRALAEGSTTKTTER